MLSSADCEESNISNKSKSLNRVSSTSSSPNSPFSTFNPQNQTQQRAKTMEEVWKDINLASLHDHHSSRVDPRLHNPQNPHFILQDFLAKSSSKDPPRSIVSSTNGDTTIFASPLLTPPDTVLSLNSGPEFGFLDTSHPLVRPNSHVQSHHISNVSSFNSPFEGLGPSSGFGSFGKKRVQESGSSSNDRRHKRMIKNRESAARSRARKQAYTNELQLEVAQLMEENARLKRLQEQQWCLAAASQVHKKHTLHRTSTAPF